MRLSCNRVEWTRGEIMRNVLVSVALLLALFLWDNRDYLFQYKLHESQYTKVWGRVEISHHTGRGFSERLMGTKSKIRVQLEDGEKVIRFPETLGDALVRGETIPMVYSPTREPELCRGSLVITDRFLMLLVLLVGWNIRQVRV